MGDARNHVGPAIAAALDGRSQQWLADRLAEQGVKGATQAMVSRWIRQLDAIRPDQLFAIERALGVEPGTLSRLEGYLPVDLRDSTDIESAILGEERLRPTDKSVLVRMVRALLDGE